METVLLWIVLVLSVINSFCLFGIGVFLVRFRDRINNIFADLFEALEVMWGATPPAPTTEANDNRPKTWDEKYEEELEGMTRRLRAESGLVSLPDPGVSWGTPPALNEQNTQGLTIKNK